MKSGLLTKNIAPAGNIVVVRASGSTIWDQQGKAYLDFASQTLNLNWGHSHPEIVRAAKDQLDQFYFLSTRFVSPPLMDLAEKIVRISPNDLSTINLKLTNGSDANESAIKRARKFTGKHKIATFFHSHLGETAETICASGKHFENRKYIGGSQEFVFFKPPHPDFFGGNISFPASESRSLAEFEKLAQTNELAGVIVEPVMVNAGAYVLSKHYLLELRRLCDNYGISLIFDEIQTAFGWLNDFFAASIRQVVPDMITLGKALSSGFPLAGILMKPKYDVLDYCEDEFTYGGHPVSCAVALKNIHLLENAFNMNAFDKTIDILNNHLSELKNQFSQIKEVRGEGFIRAIAFDPNQCQANRVYETCLSKGLITRKTQDGHGSAIVIKPPLVVTEQEIGRAFDILTTVINFCES